MPRFGLAAASGHEPAVGMRATARLRLERQGAAHATTSVATLNPDER